MRPRVRVISTPGVSTSRKPPCHMYLAPLSRLTFDPGRWRWRSGGTLHAYSAKQRRRLCNPHLRLSLLISTKWTGWVPGTFRPNWQEVWNPQCPRKEAAFIWSIYHYAIAVNQWRQHAFPTISDRCPCCPDDTSESLMHCIFKCGPATKV